MQARQWILGFFTIVLLILSSVQLWLLYKDIPLRFSNSISYDAKLAFLDKTNLLDKADTLVIGSSMALNNINGVTLEENSSQIHKVANIASWGLEPFQTLQLLKSIDLKNIKTIIYGLQYDDFTQVIEKHIYNQQEVKDFLHHQKVLTPYFKRFTSAREDFRLYNNFDKIYHDSHHYQSLKFDRTGSVPLDINQSTIDKVRWEGIKWLNDPLNPRAYTSLKTIIYLARDHDIKLIVARSPIRPAVLKARPEAKKRVESFSNMLQDLAKRKHFIYLDFSEKLSWNNDDFVDFEHLDIEGTELYTKGIIKYGGLE